jgi:hypothetical protein
MVSPDVLANEQSKQRGWVKMSDESQRYVSTGPNPPFLMHGTDIESALSILRCRKINTSPGIAGEGIYCFACQGDDHAAIGEAWNRGTAGGYNWGAGFLLKLEGCVVKSSYSDILPSGCVGRKKDQYAASPTAISYAAVVFNENALMGALGDHMDAIGYSAQLHSALVDVEQYLKQRRQQGSAAAAPLPQEQVTMLQNAIVSTSNKKRNQEEAAGASASASSPSAGAATFAGTAAVSAAASAASSTAASLGHRPLIIYPTSPFDVAEVPGMLPMTTMMWPVQPQEASHTQAGSSWPQNWCAAPLWASHAWDSWHSGISWNEI